MNKLSDVFILNNGYQIPCVGFGTWRMPNDETGKAAAVKAIETGYRHIDTAAYYFNEECVGEAIRESGIDRKEIFVTSKVFNNDRGYKKTLAAFEKTMNNLKTDYLDLYLIHWPAVEKQYKNWEEINLDTWRAMTELYKTGRIKAIGVSNFKPHHLRALMEMEIKPMVNQIEYHPGHTQKETVDYCKKHNIVVEAWSPLGRGKALKNAALTEIAGKYGKTVAQLCVRWCLQNDILPLPKSVTPSRIEENAKVFDFSISGEDIDAINNMGNFAFSGLDPDDVDF